MVNKANGKSKNNSSKAKKAKVTKLQEVTPATEVAEPKVEVQSYMVPVFFKREPVDKDIPVADIFYHKVSNQITLACYAPNHEASIEMLIGGDISVTTAGSVEVISKAESPIKWITNLSKSNEFSGQPFLAREAQEVYEA